MFVPLNTGSLRLIGQRHLNSITIMMDDLSRSDLTQEAARQVILQAHGGVEDFQIRNMASLLENVASTQNTFTVLLGSIAAISLLVGGIGVMNIMLVTVTERTREIGIRKSVGARRRDIMRQFLFEAFFLCLLGGAIGSLSGMLFGNLTALFFEISAAFPLDWAIYGLLAVTFMAVVFGGYPAMKASRLDPIAALRYE